MPTKIATFLNLAGDDGEVSKRVAEFRRGLGPMTNLTFDPQHGGKGMDKIVDYNTYKGKANALAANNPDIYLCSCWPTLRALDDACNPATSIVFAGLLDLTPDPVAHIKLLTNKNVFGFIDYGTNLCALWPPCLSRIAPAVKRAAVVYDMTSMRPNADLAYNAINAAKGSLKGTKQSDLDKIDIYSQNLKQVIKDFANCTGPFAGGGPCTPGGLIVAGGTPMATIRKTDTLIKAANANSLPAVYSNRTYVDDGGLISIGTYTPDLYLKAGDYAKQILSGTPPKTKIDITQIGNAAVFETAINLTTAAPLGLSATANAIPADYIVPAPPP